MHYHSFLLFHYFMHYSINMHYHTLQPFPDYYFSLYYHSYLQYRITTLTSTTMHYHSYHTYDLLVLLVLTCISILSCTTTLPKLFFALPCFFAWFMYYHSSLHYRSLMPYPLTCNAMQLTLFYALILFPALPLPCISIVSFYPAFQLVHDLPLLPASQCITSRLCITTFTCITILPCITTHVLLYITNFPWVTSLLVYASPLLLVTKHYH